MEYVIEILGKQGWERCNCLNDYFAGWEEAPDATDDDESHLHLHTCAQLCDKACQTPKEWLDLKPAQEVKEAEPGRAPPRKRALEQGTTAPHCEIRVQIDLL